MRERFSNAKQVIVIVGDHTKSLYKFVRWEMDIALKLDLPIIATNLNGTHGLSRYRTASVLFVAWRSERGPLYIATARVPRLADP